MIEIIKYPKNSKQIGEPEANRKIYMEDYVYTYTTSLAYDAGTGTEYGVLLGECQRTENESCLFIRGAVRVTREEPEDPSVLIRDVEFGQAVWGKIYEDMEQYFRGQAILGWFLSVPDLAPERMAAVKKLHLDNFAGAPKTLFLINQAEREENFYLVEEGELIKQKGFVCFYERNEAMQEYMLGKRSGRSVDEDAQDQVVQNFRTIIQERKEEVSRQKSISFMYMACTFMVVVVIVIGINMMNSYDKMQKLDSSVNQIVQEIANMNVTSEGLPMGDDSTPVNQLAGNVFPTIPAATKAEQGSDAQSETQAGKQTETQVNGQTGVPTAADGQAGVPAAATADGQVTPTTDGQTAPAEPQTAAQQTPASVTAAAAPMKTYVVKKGDTLISICRNVYGDAGKYVDVMTANAMTDPDKLLVGQELKMPQ